MTEHEQNRVRPLIGITGRRKTAAIMGAPGGYADAPIEAYLSEYATAVLSRGGLPVHLPLDAPPAELVGRLDGIVISGGDDIDPRAYGQAPGPFTLAVDPQRDRFEIALLAAARARGIPVLGICRGAQLINVALGGTLHQHLATGEGESHGSYAYPRAHRVHEVATVPGTVVAAVYGETLRVNSFHHQSIAEPGEGVRVAGVAPDGVIEAIEVDGADIVGVQWHPENFAGDPVFGWLADRAGRASAPNGESDRAGGSDQNRTAA